MSPEPGRKPEKRGADKQTKIPEPATNIISRDDLLKHLAPAQRMVYNRPAYVPFDQLDGASKQYPTLNWKGVVRQNPHAEAGVHRLGAIRTVLAQKVGTNNKIVVQHFYPAGREVGYKSKDNQMEIVDCRPPRLAILAGDRVEECPSRNAGDFAMMVDIYKLGDRELTIDNLAYVLESPRPVEWIGRLHRGNAGVAIGEVWVKRNGSVYSKPPGESMWPAHKPFSLDLSHGQQVTFTVNGQNKVYIARVTFREFFGPYAWYEIDWVELQPGSVALDPRPAVDGEVEMREIPYSLDWINWWRRGVKRLGDGNMSLSGPAHRPVRVFLRTLPNLATLRARLGHGANLDTALSSVKSTMQSDPTWKIFVQEFPEDASQIIFETATYGLYGTRLADVDAIHADRNATGWADQTLSTLRGTNFKPEDETWWVRFGVLRVLLITLGTLLVVAGLLTVAGLLGGKTADIYDNTKDLSPLGTASPRPVRPSGNIHPGMPPQRKIVETHHVLNNIDMHHLPKQNELVTFPPVADHFAFVAAVMVVSVLVFFFLRRRQRLFHRLKFSEIWRQNSRAMSTHPQACYDLMDTRPVPRVEGDYAVFPAGEEMRASITIKQGGVTVQEGRILTSATFDALPYEDVSAPGWWPLATSTVAFKAPANTLRNTVVALAARNLKNHGVAQGAEVDYRWEWTAAMAVQAGVFPRIDHPYTITEVGSSRGGAARRAWFTAVAGYELNGWSGDFSDNPKNKNALKLDETLKPANLDSESDQVKPRVIGTVAPEGHVFTVPMASAMKKAIIEHWKENVFTMRGRHFKLFFGAGLSPEEQDNLTEEMKDFDGVSIAVAGDDSMVRLETGEFCTADYSAYDSTQGFGNLVLASEQWMNAMGAPPEFQHFFHKVYDANFAMRKKQSDFEVSGIMPYQFATGLAITTLSNSVSNALALIYAVLEAGNDISRIEPSLEEMGLKPKLNVYPDTFGLDFLKGLYLPAVDGKDTWHRMPSAVIKLGKVSRDPLALTKQARLPISDPILAAKLVAKSIAKGMQSSDRSCPILGDVLRLYDSFEIATDYKFELNQVVEDAGYTRLVRVNRAIDPATWLELCARRYNITADEIAEFRLMVDSLIIKPVFPVLLHSPVFAKLRDIDYG